MDVYLASNITLKNTCYFDFECYTVRSGGLNWTIEKTVFYTIEFGNLKFQKKLRGGVNRQHFLIDWIEYENIEEK